MDLPSNDGGPLNLVLAVTDLSIILALLGVGGYWFRPSRRGQRRRRPGSRG